ncbi:MAG: reverse transcriptase/maturase family protein [Candidatus Thiodiazotropha taylori]
MITPSFTEVCNWSNLIAAWRKAARGKRGKSAAAGFEYQLADQLLQLQDELLTGRYRPGCYTHFHIQEPKQRLISAAPFRDRVVHHALCNQIEPLFERHFIQDSYANRTGKGTHRAIDRLQLFTCRYSYVLQLDIEKHFPAMDHQILLTALSRVIIDEQILQLIELIIASGKDVHDQEHRPHYFPGDDLFALCRPRGLPIGNLTSQFWSNCYLHPLDLFIKRELGCRTYLRYVDDFCLFSNRKQELWAWKKAIRDYLAMLRLRFHENSAQVMPVRCGIPWLGFIIYPTHRRLKARKLVETSRRLGDRFEAWQTGRISFGEFDASIQGWINHVRYADSWGLRRHVLGAFRW